MAIRDRKYALLFAFLLTAPSITFGQNLCRQSLPQAIEVSTIKDLPADAVKELQSLVERDPDLALFLKDPTFIEFLQAVAEGRSIDELRPLIYKIWENPELSPHALGKKTGALLIGPNANNESRLLKVIRDAGIKSAPREMSKVEKAKFVAKRLAMQIKGLGLGLANAKRLIKTEMHPSEMDANLFDFYGYLNLKLDSSRLREWETPPGSFAEIKLSDIRGMDPLAFVKVLMLASQIEAPVDQYSDASGHIFSLYPQAARFMGKTEEQADAHRKARRKLHCTNSWCEEENRHESLLENLGRRLIGLVLPNSKPFSADTTLSPFRPEDVSFHVVARANNELAASSTYFILGAHAEGNTATYLTNIRKDELKHSTVFAGLYHYLHGNTYWSRLRGVIRKTLIELTDKNDKSEYASVLKTEPITLLEAVYSQVQYEIHIKNYLKILPLKTLRKFFESDINLEALPETPMEPTKKARMDQLLNLEKSRREALASWPTAQRKAAYSLEYFESEFNSEISKIIAQKFKYFEGAEDFGNSLHLNIQKEIATLTPTGLKNYGFTNVTPSQLSLLKTSLNDTLRDYQIMFNKKVRKMQMRVQFIDAVHGFEIVKDAAYDSQKKVEMTKPLPASATAATTSVVSVKKITDSTFLLRVQKPSDFEFSPGASINITLQSPHGVQSRILSISNSPKDNYLEFAVRNSDSYFKEALWQLKSGQTILVDSPKSGLKFNSDAPAVMIAGGIGITPFRGIIKTLNEQKISTPVTLLYANGNEKDIAFREELDELAKSNSSLNIRHVISKPSESWTGEKGRIDKAYLAAVVADAPESAIYYIVAPLPMVTSVRSALAELGVAPQKIMVESFAGYR
jgi:ferredoxin-NADP reductase